MEDNILGLVREALKSATGAKVEELSSNQNLFEAGVLDSLSMIQFIIALEGQFGVAFDYKDVQMDHFKTLENIRSMVGRMERKAN